MKRLLLRAIPSAVLTKLDLSDEDRRRLRRLWSGIEVREDEEGTRPAGKAARKRED